MGSKNKLLNRQHATRYASGGAPALSLLDDGGLGRIFFYHRASFIGVFVDLMAKLLAPVKALSPPVQYQVTSVCVARLG